MTLTRWEVPPKHLCSRYDPQQFPFETTENLPYEEEVIGQVRAVRAMDFGLHIQDRGYNIFVSGVPGTGKNTIVKSMIKRVAETQPTPDDWCYVNNFQDPDRPKVLNLPAGKGRELQRDIERLIASLREEFPKVFQSKDYEDQRRLIEEGFSKARDSLTRDLEDRAKENGFEISSTRLGVVVIPIYRGKPLEAEQLEALDPSIRTEIQRKEKLLHEHIHTFAQQVRALREEVDRKTEQLNRRVAHFTSDHSFESLREKYQAFPKVMEYIQALKQDVLENFKDFLPAPESPIQLPSIEVEPARKSITRYEVNAVVDNSGVKGAPLVEEINPTYNHLVGRIEKKGRFGTLYTDFTLIKAGSLLQANGGYLLLNVLDVLRSPFSWEALKRVIKNQEVKIEDIGELYGFIASAGIKPEPIPIHLRVILVGNPFIYYLLYTYDEDFGKIFKVKVDFDIQQNRVDESPVQYARFIARLCRNEALLHFDRSAVATVLEQVSRWTSHQKKLSLQFSDLADLVRESSHWARQDGKAYVSREHVQKAVEEKVYRSNLLEEHIRELIAEGTLMVDVTGAVVGQINGLSVHDLGDFAFGRPSRITARVFLGQSGIMNIEREAKLSGKTHSKGVLILSGYLGGRYARENPLSLSASLCFEQCYSEVEGDSASAAELVALLSSLSDLPLRQGIAITGSVNQRGELQAIGGLNEKIEGFYAVCKALGLTGEQGVIIPRQNTKHLMLKEEVVEAVASGKFHVYAVSTADEAMEILTGCTAGDLQPDGTYPAGTVNSAVQNRLREMGEKLRAMEEKKSLTFPASVPDTSDEGAEE
ncbi:MAG TPA: ATP-binding protein [Nitrospiria bacterium]|nr:ATP-binding protein [Nitrospiria bacterium]